MSRAGGPIENPCGEFAGVPYHFHHDGTSWGFSMRLGGRARRVFVMGHATRAKAEAAAHARIRKHQMEYEPKGGVPPVGT